MPLPQERPPQNPSPPGSQQPVRSNPERPPQNPSPPGSQQPTRPNPAARPPPSPSPPGSQQPARPNPATRPPPSPPPTAVHQNSDTKLIPDFSDEPLKRALFGIDGLDEMLSGGLIQGSVTALIGQYGTGKTSFALNFVMDGLKRGESVLYLALEERRARLLQYMHAYGFDIEKYLKSGKLLVVNLDPSDFNLAIQSVKNEIPILIRETQADRLVIDPISLFEDLFDDDATRRRELMRFLETVRDLTSCTSLFTSETDKSNSFSSRYNLIEYLSDTTILLRYVRSSEASEVHLAVEVVKMRMSPHFREAKPYILNSGMITVYTDATVF